MKLENKSTRAYIAYGVRLNPKEVKDIDDQRAINILLKQEGISEYADVEEQKALQEENARLKEQLKAQNKPAKKTGKKKK